MTHFIVVSIHMLGELGFRAYSVWLSREYSQCQSVSVVSFQIERGELEKPERKKKLEQEVEPEKQVK